MLHLRIFVATHKQTSLIFHCSKSIINSVNKLNLLSSCLYYHCEARKNKRTMGVAASIARKQVSRPLKNYNVEERAMKVISQDKPTPAPPHPSMKQVMDEIKRDPSKMKTTRTDPALLKNLSKVYIKSTGDNPEIVARPFPSNRTPPEETLLGYEDPKNLPAGKASLRHVLEILQKKSQDQENFTPEQIVAEYKLDMVDAMNLTQYYKAMLILKPPPNPKKKSLNPLRRLQDGIDNLKK